MPVTILPDDSYNTLGLGPGEEVLPVAKTVFYPDSQGPLAGALENPYETVSLQYPRDLNSSRKGHSVLFTMFETKTDTIQDVINKVEEIAGRVKDTAIKEYDELAARSTQAMQRMVENPSTFVEETIESGRAAVQKNFENISEGAKKLLAGEYTTATINVGTRVRNLQSAAIQLYMPENVQFEYTSQYETFSLADAIGSAHIPLVSAGARAITSIIDKGGNTAARGLLNYAGYVFNPQQQMMFEGIDFRNYAMSFTFTPFSSGETETVKKIIKTFREHAAPTIIRSIGGFFFNPPSVFQIKYLHNGDENQYLPKLKRCVLENVSVDYSPNGWSAFGDGSPTQITMTLAFREIELVDRKDIQNGY